MVKKDVTDLFRYDDSFLKTRGGGLSIKRIKGNVFTLELIIYKLQQKYPDVPYYKLRNICMLQFFMIHQVINEGSFYEVDIPNMGKMRLLPYQRNAKLEHGDIHSYFKKVKSSCWKNLDEYGFEDPFLELPLQIIKKTKGPDVPPVESRRKGKWIKTILKKYNELGQRYYVLDSKPTA